MSRIIYLMGKSSSGKDTIFKELLRHSITEAGLVQPEKIVPYTTRPIRAGERDGEEYYFTDEAGFQKWQEKGRIIEDRAYHTCHGLWRYFTVDDGQIKTGDHLYITIGTLEAYSRMRERFGEETMLPVMIELDDGVRLQRALDREKAQTHPKYEEMCRRFLADSSDFSEEKLALAGIERRFQNDDLQRCLAEITAYIRAEIDGAGR